jgi:N-methylhydantoinase A
VATIGIRLDRDSPAALEAAFRRLEDEARAVMADTGLKLEMASVKRLADGRFLGQGFDLVVDLPTGPYDDTPASRQQLTAAFESAYREKFALMPPDVPVEFINIRVAVRAPVAGAEVAVHGDGRRGGAAIKGVRPAYFPERRAFEETTVYDREAGAGRRARRPGRGRGRRLHARDRARRRRAGGAVGQPDRDAPVRLRC